MASLLAYAQGYCCRGRGVDAARAPGLLQCKVISATSMICISVCPSGLKKVAWCMACLYNKSTGCMPVRIEHLALNFKRSETDGGNRGFSRVQDSKIHI